MTIVLNGTSGITTPPVSVEGSTSGTITLAAPAVAGTNTQTLVAVTGTLAPLIAGTAVASTSGTSIDFTSIPSWVKRITVMFNGVSTNGSSALQVQIGDSGGIENTSYVSNAGVMAGAYPGAVGVDVTATAGFLLEYSQQAAGDILSGHLVLTNVSGNIWVGSGLLGSTTAGVGRQIFLFTGAKTLSDVLDRVRITTVGGTATFDAGSINILYE
jgi:hypothetical protein